jgi:hypothetical protein
VLESVKEEKEDHITTHVGLLTEVVVPGVMMDWGQGRGGGLVGCFLRERGVLPPEPAAVYLNKEREVEDGKSIKG